MNRRESPRFNLVKFAELHGFGVAKIHLKTHVQFEWK